MKYPGHNATFACDTECPHLRWELIPETNSSKTIVFNGTHSILTVNSNTDTVVQCIAYCVDITLTWNASLLIQGTLYMYIHVHVHTCTCVLYDCNITAQ